MRLLVLYLVTLSFLFVPNVKAEDCASISSRYRQSTVFITSAVTDAKTGAMTISYGTGVIVAKEGLVLTDAHVISATRDAMVTGAIGSREAPKTKLRLLGQNDTNDVALLQFADTSRDYSPAIMGNPWQAATGLHLCSMGYPLEADYQTTEGPLGGKSGGHGLWTTQMPSNPGESGAAVYGADNATVIALKLGEYDKAQNLNYLIPVNMAASILRDYAGIEVPSRAPTATDVKIDSPSASVPYQNAEVDCIKSTHPYGRDFCAVLQCPQGQWSRGSVSLLPKSGTLEVKQGLETDNALYGVCGAVEFRLKDDHNTIAYGFGPQRCIAAKFPGPARIQAFAPDVIQVPAPIANRVRSIEVSSVCSNDVLSPLGLGFQGDVTKGTVNVMIGTPP